MISTGAPNDNATAYEQLNSIHQGLESVLGVAWQEPRLAGPSTCERNPDELEFQLEREASTAKTITENLELARQYLSELNLEVDPDGFPEMANDQLVADRVTAREGWLFVEVRATANGKISVFTASECYSGDRDGPWGE